MAVIQNPALTVTQEVDSVFKASRQTLRPMECLAWNSIGVRTGAITTIAANAAIFSFRNISANPIIIRRVGIGFICTTGFTAAQELAFGLMIARAFTASDSAGTAIAVTGSNTKHRTALATPTSLDVRISAAAALTAGTKTLDTNHLSTTGCYAAATTAGNLLPPSPNNLLSHDAGDYPVVLAQNEGFNIMNLILMGAAGVGTAYVNMEFAEATAY